MATYWLLLTLLFFDACYGASDSDPLIVSLCDATSPHWGCDPRFWKDGDRTQCLNTTQKMSWASSPVPSDCFTIKAGINEHNPTTSYTPNTIVPLHIRVTCYKMWYRGIMLYAIDGNGNKVGDWELVAQEPEVFKRPWPEKSSNCFGTLMHASAQYKPYHSVVYFKAPPAGTGTITFQCLIKWGNANTGAFYWPKDSLMLEEHNSLPLNTTYEQTKVGQSCSEYCTSSGKSCDSNSLVSIENESDLLSELSSSFVCRLSIRGCGELPGAYDQTNQYCYYQAENCSQVNNNSICDIKTEGLSRFCTCNKQDDEHEIVISGSSSLVTNSMFIVSFLLLFLTNPKYPLVVLLLFSMVNAHNWINSGSRSPWQASPLAPCKPARTNLPFAQVGPDQPFQIEWTTGHGDFAYFSIVNSIYESKLNLHTFDLLEDYIANAPPGSNQAMTRGLQKYHRKDTETLDNDVPSGTTPNFFRAFINESSPIWIYRPPSFLGEIGNIQKPDNSTPTYLVSYKDDSLANDVRVSYQSEKYPWIEAVYKFQIVTMAPHRPDTTNFYIPGFEGYGRYIVHYMWRGYRDCIDIDYKPTQVSNIYGYPPAQPAWKRIDHCLFENVKTVMSTTYVVTDPQYCLTKCNGQCTGVNVVPLKAPSSAFQNFTPPVGDTWYYPNIYGTDIYIPWDKPVMADLSSTYLANPSADIYICYSVQAASATDTTDEFTLSEDPDDPIFYSTCYYKYNGNTFDDYVNSTVQANYSIPWNFNTKCLDCNNQATNSLGFVTPKWNITDSCTNCDLQPGSPEQVSPTIYTVDPTARCDGFGNTWTYASHNSCNDSSICYKQLSVVGRAADWDLTPEECHELTRQDPDCSSTFMLHTIVPMKCYCYTKNSCCNNCSRSSTNFYATFELDTVPDPTCALGVKSNDGTACCSGTCSKCGSSQGSPDIGFCCSTCIKNRPCSLYGPPCNLS